MSSFIFESFKDFWVITMQPQRFIKLVICFVCWALYFRCTSQKQWLSTVESDTSNSFIFSATFLSSFRKFLSQLFHLKILLPFWPVLLFFVYLNKCCLLSWGMKQPGSLTFLLCSPYHPLNIYSSPTLRSLTSHPWNCQSGELLD